MARRIFDIEHERAARSRNVRPDVAYPLPESRLFGQSFGATVAPYLNDAQVLGLPAMNRALGLIADGVAGMTNEDGSLDVFEPDGVTKAAPTNITTRPWSMVTAYDYWVMAVLSYKMHGNFVGIYADFDAAGYPRQ